MHIQEYTPKTLQKRIRETEKTNSCKPQQPSYQQNNIQDTETLEGNNGVPSNRARGHKNIKNTLVYTHLVQFTEKDEYVSKIARTDDEFAVLIELGFEYVGPTPTGNAAFRKRK